MARKAVAKEVATLFSMTMSYIPVDINRRLVIFPLFHGLYPQSFDGDDGIDRPENPPFCRDRYSNTSSRRKT